MAANSDAEHVFSADGPLGLTPTAGSGIGSGGGTGAADAFGAGEGVGALRTGLATLAGVRAAAGVEDFLALGGLGGFPNSRTTFAASWLWGIIQLWPSFLALSFPSRMSLEMVAAGIPVALANSRVVIDLLGVAIVLPFMRSWVWHS
jgi:hypothetical protein